MYCHLDNHLRVSCNNRHHPLRSGAVRDSNLESDNYHNCTANVPLSFVTTMAINAPGLI